MERIKKLFDDMGMTFTEDMREKYLYYMKEILDKNQFINLTAIKEEDEFISKHYIDSLMCCSFPEFLGADSIVDLGTGGGFPGVPLAIAFPDKKFVLIDSLNKRIKIINELCEKLGISNVTAVHGRAEELGRRKEMRESFDLCVSRAVANMSTLAEYCLPFVRPGGWFIAYKGPDSDDEIKKAVKAAELLGGKISRIQSVKTDDFEMDHRLVFINKIKNTDMKFPRKAGIPSKEPIS